MDIVGPVVVGGVGFARNALGVITKPYETYRRIVEHGSTGEFLYLFATTALYFALASIVKQASFRPFLLTRQFVTLGATAGVSFLLSGTTIWIVGRLVGGHGKWEKTLLAWGYTLIPTLVWFLATSLLYVFLPPPRTTSILGIIFSIVYLVFSVTLLFWKVILSYLTLRFSLRLDLGRSILVAAVVLPVFTLYSIGMYRLGVFRVPFL